MKTAAERDTEHVNLGDYGLLHGTQVLKKLVAPWTNRNLIVCANSYFAAVGCCKKLKIISLSFISVVKTATKPFLVNHISRIKLVNRGDFSSLVCRDLSGNPKFWSFV